MTRREQQQYTGIGILAQFTDANTVYSFESPQTDLIVVSCEFSEKADENRMKL